MTLSAALNVSCPAVVRTHHDSDDVIVVVAGEFDLANANPIREALTRAVGERPRRVIVDLGDVTFIDSSGLHVIVETYALCREAGSALKIRPGPRSVQRVFELTNILRYLPFETSG